MSGVTHQSDFISIPGMVAGVRRVWQRVVFVARVAMVYFV